MPRRTITTKGLLFTLIFCCTLWATSLWGDLLQIRQPDGSSVSVDCLPVAVDQEESGTALFRCDQARWLSAPGEPRIPWQVVTVLLPPQADLDTVSCRIEAENYEPLEGIWDVAPMPPIATWENDTEIIVWPEDKNIVMGRDIDIYETNAFWPGETVRVVSTGRLHSWRLAEIAIPLVIYNSVRGRVCQLRNMTVTLDYVLRENLNGATSMNASPQTHLRGRSRIRQMAVNFEAAKSAYEQDALGMDPVVSDEDGIDGSGVLAPNLNANGYVIITTSAIQNASSKLANFVAHKQSQGFTVTVITESNFGGGQGDTAANNVREWLQANYLNSAYGTNGILYVLLLGNPHPTNGYVPMKMCIEDHPTDYFYAELTGNWDADGDGIYGESEDNVEKYFEVYVGRIPYYGVISDTDHILQKTIDYENASEANWRRNVLLPMVPLDDSTPSYQLGEQIKANLLEPQAITSDRIYDETYGVIPPPEYLRAGNYPATVWSQGIYGLNVWMTHGWSQGASGIISSGETPNLNDAYPTATWQGSCENGHPEDTNNLAYAILKNGGIATVGASRNAWYYVGQSNFTNTSSVGGMGYQYARRIVERKTCGQALYDSKEALSYWQKNYFVMNLYGDPSVVVMPATPLFTVSPTDDFYITRIQGADFSLTSRSYTLTNHSSSTINWTATKTADWLDLPSGGGISGGTGYTFNFSLTDAANYLPVGTHTATITFTDATHGIACERAVKLIVQPCKLAGYWRLDETSGTTAHDSSVHGYLGSLEEDQTFDTDSVSGYISNALNFDGVDDYVELPALGFQTDRATITAWIKRNGDQKDWAGIVFRTTGDDTGLNLNTSNGLRYHWNNASNTYNWESGLTVPDNQWTFVALVVLPNQATIYMYDGTLHSATNTVTHGMCSFDIPGAIGRDRSDREFAGAIDDVRIYNYALDATAITDLIAGVRVENIIPCNEAVNVGLPVLSWVGGAAAVRYDVYVGFRYDAVANATTSSSEYIGRLTSTRYELPILYQNTDYYWRIDGVDASNSVTHGAVWHFTAGNGTGSVSRHVWLDISGTQISDLINTPGYPYNPDLINEINTFETPTDWADDYGTLVYGYLHPRTTGNYTFWIATDDYGELWLSTDEYLNHASRIAHVPGWSDPREWDKFSQQQSAPIPLVAGRVYYLLAVQKEHGGGDNLAVAWQGPGIAQQVIDGEYLSAGLFAGAPSALLSHWKLDETAGAVADDAVGDNDGALTHFVTDDSQWIAGKFDGALQFDGHDDFIELGDSSSLKSNLPLTLAAWIRHDEVGTDSQVIVNIDKKDDDAEHRYFGPALLVMDTGQVAVSFGDGQPDYSSRYKIGNSVLQPNIWYHVAAAIRSPVDMSLYINGQDDGGVINGAGGDIAYADGNSQIGSLSGKAYFLRGALDDVRLYRDALNVDQIKSVMDYRIGWWKLDDATGWCATDGAGRSNGKLLNFGSDDSQWIPGKFQGALQFDGVADFVDLGNSTSLKPALPITLASWVRFDQVGDYQILINLDKKDYDDEHRYYGSDLLVLNTGQIAASVGDGQPDSSLRYKIGDSILRPNTWYHLAVVIRSSNDITLYVNGYDDGGAYGGAGGAMVYSSDGASQLGARFCDALYSLHGEMDDVRIYDRALTDAEIAVLARPLLDLNNNGWIDMVDLSLLSDNWLESGCAPLSSGDFNVDCDVDLTDYNRLAAQWLQEVK